MSIELLFTKRNLPIDQLWGNFLGRLFTRTRKTVVVTTWKTFNKPGVCVCVCVCVWRGEGGGGVLRISSEGDDRIWASNKTQKNIPKKILCQNLRAFNISRKHYNTRNKLEVECLCLGLGYASTSKNLQIVLNGSPQKSLLKSSHPKKRLAQFSFPKKSRNRNFEPKKSLDYPRNLNLGGKSSPRVNKGPSWSSNDSFFLLFCWVRAANFKSIYWS